MQGKKVLVYGGIVLVWVGGCWIAYKTGEILGEGIGKLCSKATDRLLAFL